MMILTCIALILASLGAINWFTIGVFNFNFVTALLPIAVANILYIAIGLAGLWLLIHSIVRMSTVRKDEPAKRVNSRHSA